MLIKTFRPAVRKELYKKMWVELDSMAKQAKEKTHGQEDLANAIFAASTLEPIVIEESESAKPFKLVY